MASAVAKPIRSWSKVFTSSIRGFRSPRSVHAGALAAPVVFVVAAAFGPTDVDAELLGRAEDVLVELSHLDFGAVGREHLDVEAQGLHLLDEHLEALRDARLRDVLALHDRLVDLHA